MKRYIYIPFCIAAVLFLGSCSKDIDEPTPNPPSEEPSEESPVNRWIYNTMKAEYYWASDMPIESQLNFGAEPDRFFLSLLSDSDGKHDANRDYYYSEIEKTGNTRSGGMEKSYGLVPCFYSYLNTDDLHMRIQYVVPGSPAEAAGIKRGDFFSKFNGIQITNSNYLTLYESTSITTLTRIKIDPITLGIISQEEVSLPSAESIHIDPFYKYTTFIANGMKISYLMYSSFDSGYAPKMRSVFELFRSDPANAFVLDLRLNSGGYIDCVQQLATLLAPASAFGDRLFYLQYRGGNKVFYDFVEIDKQYNLNLNRLYVIVSGTTASSAELIINSLKPYMGNNLIIVGTTTEGKNVASMQYVGRDASAGWSLYPITSKIFNSKDESNYSNGFAPYTNHWVSEWDKINAFDVWYEYGNPQEYLLKNVINVIQTGSVLNPPTRNQALQEVIIPKKESSMIIEYSQE